LETITIRKDYNEAEEDEMGGAYSTNGWEKERVGCWWESQREGH
jgi:hypothetical protein